MILYKTQYKPVCTAFWRFPGIWRCARGGFRHAESESEVKNCQIGRPEAKTLEKTNFLSVIGGVHDGYFKTVNDRPWGANNESLGGPGGPGTGFAMFCYVFNCKAD